MAKNRVDPIFTVQRREADEYLREIGKVSFGERGKLTLVSASAPFRGALQDIFDGVNALDELRIKVPPPPGAEPGSLYRRSATRSDPDLLEVLKEYLEQKYELCLAPVNAA